MTTHSGDLLAVFRGLAEQYAQAVDAGEPERLAALMTDQAVIEGPGFRLEGVDEIRGIPAQLRAYFLGTRHLVFNQTVAVDGDQAQGETYGEAQHRLRQERPQILVWHLRYRDRFVRHQGRWRFRHRQVLIDWTETRDVSTP